MIAELTWWQDIKWKLFMLKIDILMFSEEAKQRHYRRKYCRFGIHKINSNHVERWTHGGTAEETHRRVDFISCSFCDFKFFTTKDDKAWYHKHYLSSTWPKRSK